MNGHERYMCTVNEFTHIKLSAQDLEQSICCLYVLYIENFISLDNKNARNIRESERIKTF